MSRVRRTKRKSTQTREFDASRWAHLVFVLGGFVTAWVLTHAIEDIWAIVWTYYPQVGREEAFTSNVAGIAIAMMATAWAWRKAHWFQYVTEVVTEVSQVAWPTKPEIRVATMVVILMTLICSVILAGIDSVWSNATDLLYGI